MPDTTINIHEDIYTRISAAAVKLDTSRRDIIIRLLMRMMKNNSTPRRGFTTVKYQPGDATGRWHPFHICYKNDENEFSVDLRKFSKYSVSFILAIAVEKYLDQLTGDANEKGMYNYTGFSNYVIYREVVEGIISWRLYWGYPPEELKSLKL
jgi:hypothetical protein